jgi:cation transport ATPase
MVGRMRSLISRGEEVNELRKREEELKKEINRKKEKKKRKKKSMNQNRERAFFIFPLFHIPLLTVHICFFFIFSMFLWYSCEFCSSLSFSATILFQFFLNKVFS